MLKIISKIIIVFFLSIILSCADQNRKVVVEGGEAEISSVSESIVSEDKTLGEKINVEDNLVNDQNISSVYEKKLLEVGDRVFFDYDQSRFKKEAVETLKRQAKFLIANSDITVTIEGHCDARGTREYNLALGERRAYAVKTFLTSLGVSEDKISVISYGKEKLQETGNNEKAWAQSRTAITVINP